MSIFTAKHEHNQYICPQHFHVHVVMHRTADTYTTPKKKNTQTDFHKKLSCWNFKKSKRDCRHTYLIWDWLIPQQISPAPIHSTNLKKLTTGQRLSGHVRRSILTNHTSLACYSVCSINHPQSQFWGITCSSPPKFRTSGPLFATSLAQNYNPLIATVAWCKPLGDKRTGKHENHHRICWRWCQRRRCRCCICCCCSCCCAVAIVAATVVIIVVAVVAVVAANLAVSI